jgi:hypothetical protein
MSSHSCFRSSPQMRPVRPDRRHPARRLADQPIGYVDLRSPSGIGVAAGVCNYDGRVFASDEGRVLAEMGDRTFELGDLHTDDYRSFSYQTSWST